MVLLRLHSTGRGEGEAGRGDYIINSKMEQTGGESLPELSTWSHIIQRRAAKDLLVIQQVIRKKYVL